jgi:hypothetical protein
LVGGLWAGLAVALLTTAVLCLPPVLERYVLTTGRVDGPLTVVLLYGLAAVSAGAAAVSARQACKRRREVRFLRTRRRRFAAVSVLIALVGAAGVAEVAARLLVRPLSTLVGDEWWRYRYAAEHPDALPRNGSIRNLAITRHHPLRGWALQPGYRSATTNINAQGIRGLREHPHPKPPGERRIVIVGDSFTFGEEVADADVYTERLDALMDGVRVVGLGVPAYGTDQQFLTLREEGLAVDPDLVVVGFFAGNAARNTLSFRDYIKPRFAEQGGAWQLKNVPIPAPTDCPWLTTPPGPGCYLWALAKKAVVRVRDRTWWSPRWPVTEAILDKIARTTRDHGARLLLLYIPSTADRQREDTEIFIEGWAARTGTPLLNLRDVFAALPDPDRRRVYRFHWTPYGHDVVARALRDLIERDGLLDSRHVAALPSTERDRVTDIGVATP